MQSSEGLLQTQLKFNLAHLYKNPETYRHRGLLEAEFWLLGGRNSKKCLVTVTELIAMPLTQGALGPYCHENEVSDISNSEFSRYGRLKLPIGI